jgi:hypothetical protein
LSGRTEATLDEHLSYACRRDGDREAGQLADDPPVPSSRVLPCHSKDERPGLRPDPRASRLPVRIGPMAGDALRIEPRRSRATSDGGRDRRRLPYPSRC